MIFSYSDYIFAQGNVHLRKCVSLPLFSKHIQKFAHKLKTLLFLFYYLFILSTMQAGNREGSAVLNKTGQNPTFLYYYLFILSTMQAGNREGSAILNKTGHFVCSLPEKCSGFMLAS